MTEESNITGTTATAADVAKQPNPQHAQQTGPLVEKVETYERCDHLDDLLPKKVIVNYLPTAINEQDIFAMFSPYGTIISHHLMRNRVTKQSLGYAFIEYDNEKSADDAIAGLNATQCQEKLLKVSHARPSGYEITRCNLFVKGLPTTMTGGEFRRIFAAFGEIISVRLLRRDNGQLKGSGFVRFARRASAVDAIAALDGKVLDGSQVPLHVKFADASSASSSNSANNGTFHADGLNGGPRHHHHPHGSNMGPNSIPFPTPTQFHNQGFAKRTRGGYGATYSQNQPPIGDRFGPSIPPSSMTPQGVCLFVLNFPRGWSEADLSRVFQTHGPVAACVIKNKYKDHGKLYAFVTMSDPASALNAVNTLNGAFFEDQAMQVTFKGEPSRGRRGNSALQANPHHLQHHNYHNPFPQGPTAPLPLHGDQQHQQHQQQGRGKRGGRYGRTPRPDGVLNPGHMTQPQPVLPNATARDRPFFVPSIPPSMQPPQHQPQPHPSQQRHAHAQPPFLAGNIHTFDSPQQQQLLLQQAGFMAPPSPQAPHHALPTAPIPGQEKSEQSQQSQQQQAGVTGQPLEPLYLGSDQLPQHLQQQPFLQSSTGGDGLNHPILSPSALPNSFYGDPASMFAFDGGQYFAYPFYAPQNAQAQAQAFANASMGVVPEPTTTAIETSTPPTHMATKDQASSEGESQGEREGKGTSEDESSRASTATAATTAATTIMGTVNGTSGVLDGGVDLEAKEAFHSAYQAVARKPRHTPPSPLLTTNIAMHTQGRIPHQYVSNPHTPQTPQGMFLPTQNSALNPPTSPVPTHALNSPYLPFSIPAQSPLILAPALAYGQFFPTSPVSPSSYMATVGLNQATSSNSGSSSNPNSASSVTGQHFVFPPVGSNMPMPKTIPTSTDSQGSDNASSAKTTRATRKSNPLLTTIAEEEDSSNTAHRTGDEDNDSANTTVSSVVDGSEEASGDGSKTPTPRSPGA